MKITETKPFHIQVEPNFTEETEGIKSSFKWGIINNPLVVQTRDTDYSLVAFKREDQTSGSETIQTMRLFACQIIIDMLNRQGVVDQNVVHEIDFLNDSPNVKQFIVKCLQELQGVLTEEILQQIDPLKPTKSKLNSLSFTSSNNKDE